MAAINELAHLVSTDETALTYIKEGFINCERKFAWKEEHKDLESNSSVSFLNNNNSSSAFTKEIVQLTPDASPTWSIISKRHVPDESDCASTSLSHYDAASQSTEIGQYMERSSEDVFSSSSSNSGSLGSSVSPDEEKNDITVLSVSSNEEEIEVKRTFLNEFNSDLNSKIERTKEPPRRKLSFTLESPSPILISAMKEAVIGPRTECVPFSCQVLTEKNGARVKQPRIPVIESLQFGKTEIKTKLDEKIQNEEKSTIISSFDNNEVIIPDELDLLRAMDKPEDDNNLRNSIEENRTLAGETKIVVENFTAENLKLKCFLSEFEKRTRIKNVPGDNDVEKCALIRDPDLISSPEIRNLITKQNETIEKLENEIKSIRGNYRADFEALLIAQKNNISEIIESQMKHFILPAIFNILETKCKCFSNFNPSFNLQESVKDADKISCGDLTINGATVEKKMDPVSISNFRRLPAFVKGYLTRRLMKSEHVQTIIKTIKDTTSCALEIHNDIVQEPTTRRKQVLKQDAQFFKRLINQVTTACHTFHDVFFKLSSQEQMAIISKSREFRKKLKRKQKMLKSRSLEPTTEFDISLSDNTNVFGTSKKKMATGKKSYKRYSSISPSLHLGGGGVSFESNTVVGRSHSVSSFTRTARLGFQRSPTFFSAILNPIIN